MTPFETRVAEALNAAFAEGNTTLEPGDVLAPRVAAAIHASADAAVDQDYSVHEAAALAALRGGSA